jgi:Tfp pilus assembly protein PilO
MDSANRSIADALDDTGRELARARQRDLAMGNLADPIGTIASQLPPAEGVPKFVEDVQLRAGHEGLQVDRTEYQVQSALHGRALRYQLTMPAHGTYPGLRAWVAGLLHEYPNATLDEISLRRESDGAGQLEARVVFSFYSRSAS